VTLLADDWDSRVTPLGYAISAFPVAPRFGKMLALSHQQGLLPYTVCMVAALSVQEVLLEAPIPKCQDEIENPKQTRAQWSQTRRNWAGVANSLLLGTCDYLLTSSLYDLRFFTAVTMKNAVFWDVTPCGSCKNRRFRRT
jgi:HrpA-like RNA helicase